jgi:alkene monooxygenase coupling protein
VEQQHTARRQRGSIAARNERGADRSEEPSNREEREREAGGAVPVSSTSKADGDLVKERDTVGISLIVSEEANTAVDMVRAEMPDARVDDHDCYYKIERDGILEFDMANLSERLGREVTVHDFLVNMTSYYGRIVVQDGLVQIYAEILPERFRD